MSRSVDPGKAGPGFLRLLDNDASGSALCLIACDGANWWHFTGSKASSDILAGSNLVSCSIV